MCLTVYQCAQRCTVYGFLIYRKYIELSIFHSSFSSSTSQYCTFSIICTNANHKFQLNPYQYGFKWLRCRLFNFLFRFCNFRCARNDKRKKVGKIVRRKNMYVQLWANINFFRTLHRVFSSLLQSKLNKG